MERESEEDQCWIDRELGKGSYGNVYLLTSTHSPHGAHSKFALKVMNVHGVGAEDQAATHKELRIMRGLCHPSIVTLVDSFQAHQRLLLVLELCEGGDLRNYLDRQKKSSSQFLKGVEESLVVQWSVQLTDGLQYLHQKKILHRDLKPQNIFLKDKFSIKIGDLGIARQLMFTREMAATHIGTPLYISPEIYQGNPYSYKTDVWSLGCCVYEMMTLQYAFHAPSKYELVGKVVNNQVLPLPQSYCHSLRNLVMDMLCKDPEERPHARQLLGSLKELKRDRSPPPWQRQDSSDTARDRSVRPPNPRSLELWHLRMAKALSQFLQKKQAIQFAQINAALAEKLTADSIKDVGNSSGAGSSHPAPSGRQGRHGESRKMTNSGGEELDGAGSTGASSLSQSGSSDRTVSPGSTQLERSSAGSTLCDSRPQIGSKHGRVATRSRCQPESTPPGNLQQNRQGEVSEADSDASNSENGSDDSLGDTTLPSTRIKVGKSSMVVPIRPLPLPKLYTEHSGGVGNSAEHQVDTGTHPHLSPSASPVLQSPVVEKEATPSEPSVNGSESYPSGSDLTSNDKKVDMAYASEVLQWARARLLPSPPPQDVHGDSRLVSGRGAEGPDTGTAAPETATRTRRGGSVAVQEMASVKEVATGAEVGVANARRREEEAGGGDVVVEEAGSRDREAEKEVPVSLEKGMKKKRNFLKERKGKDDQGRVRDNPKISSKVVQQADRPSADQEMVTLYTRAQRVTFMSLDTDEMDLSIGGESYS